MRLESFKEKNKKKTGIIIFTFCCVLLIIGVFFYQSFALFETKENFNFIKGQVQDPGDLYFAYYVDDEIILTPPQKDSGYTMSNSSFCTNGVTIGWDKENWSAIVNYSNYASFANSKVKCTLYFTTPKNMMVAMKSGIYDDDRQSVGYNATYTQNGKYRETLKKIVFESEINPYEEAEEVVDFSEAQDELVLGYYVLNEDETTYTLHIQADGRIVANPNASYYFSNIAFDLLVEGLENVDTSKVTDMSYMFCKSLNSMLDLSGWDTSNVTDMSCMFSEMSHLTNISYGDNFVRKSGSKITGMFYNCPANRPTHESWNGAEF